MAITLKTQMLIYNYHRNYSVIMYVSIGKIRIGKMEEDERGRKVGLFRHNGFCFGVNVPSSLVKRLGRVPGCP